CAATGRPIPASGAGTTSWRSGAPQLDQEGRPGGASTFDADPSAVGGHQFAGDGQPDSAPTPGPILLGTPGAIGAVAAFEAVGQVIQGDARTLVHHPNLDRVRGGHRT